MSARIRCDVVEHQELRRERAGRVAVVQCKLRCGRWALRSVHVGPKGPCPPRYVLCEGPHTNAQLLAQSQHNHAARKPYAAPRLRELGADEGQRAFGYTNSEKDGAT